MILAYCRFSIFTFFYNILFFLAFEAGDTFHFGVLPTNDGKTIQEIFERNMHPAGICRGHGFF